jgi:translation elongation factor P/translation initiation factor 5A
VLVELLKKGHQAVHKLTGQIVNTSKLGAELNVLDVDGSEFDFFYLQGEFFIFHDMQM